MNSNKILIFIPTYNEAENVVFIIELLQKLPFEKQILFVDDNSPDGTGDILDKISLKYQNLKVLHRTGKLGIGSAHKFGIKWAYENKFNTLITMDSDLTHSPEYILTFLEKSKNYDIVVGSRYLLKDSLKTWNYYRKFLTNLGHFLTKILLNMPYDASGAFRAYKLDSIDKNIFSTVKSDSYSFFFESLYLLNLAKYSIGETPIDLPSRTYGTSKMKLKDVYTSLQQLLRLFILKNQLKKNGI